MRVGVGMVIRVAGEKAHASDLLKFRDASNSLGDFLQVVFEQRERPLSAQVAA